VAKGSRLLQMMDADPQMFMRRILPDLPAVPLAVGERWHNILPDSTKNAMMEVVVTPNTVYTLSGTETFANQPCQRLTFSGPLAVTGKGSRMGAEFFIEGEGKSDGSILYNEKDKIIMIAESTSEQLMSIAVTGSANMTMTQTQTMHSKMTLMP